MPLFKPSEPLVVASTEDLVRAVDLLNRKGFKVYTFNPVFEGKTGAVELTFASRFPDREVWMTFSFGDDHTEFHLSLPSVPLGVKRNVTRIDAQIHLTRGDTDFDALIKRISVPNFYGFLFGHMLNKTQSYALARIPKTEPDYPKMREAYNSTVAIIGGNAPEVETMHTISGWDESRTLTESVDWEITPRNIAELKSAAEAKKWKIKGGGGGLWLGVETSISIPSRTNPVLLEILLHLSDKNLFSLDGLRILTVSVQQFDGQPKEFQYDFYASLNVNRERWMISPLDSRSEILDSIKDPDFEDLLTIAPSLLKAAAGDPTYFASASEKGKLRRELRQISRTAKHLIPYAPLLKKMFEFLVAGPSVPEIETMHTISGWDESRRRLTETWTVPLENRKRAADWARRNFPKEFSAEALFRKGETESAWYEFTFDWGRATDTAARAELYFGQEEIHLIFEKGHPGPDYASAPDHFEDYITNVGAASEIENIPGSVYRRMKVAYEGFLAILRPPPEIGSMHTVSNWDEGTRRYPTEDFSEMTNRDWRRIGHRASAIDPRIVFHEQSARITLYRAEGDPGFNIALTPLPVNSPKIAEIRVELEIDKPPEYLTEETIILPDRFPLTYEGITGDERFAEGKELWVEVVRLFKEVKTPEVGSMHTISGWDESGVEGIIANDVLLFERSGEPLTAEERDFKTTLEWAEKSLESETIRVAGRSGESFRVKIPSTLFPGAWISMSWVRLKTYCRFELAIPRSKSGASSRSFSGRLGALPPQFVETVVSFIIHPEQYDFDAALVELERGVIRPVTINSLRKFRKKEPSLGKLSGLYAEIHRRLFPPTPEIASMHTVSNWDEAVTKGSEDLWEAALPELEAVIARWKGSRKGREASFNPVSNTNSRSFPGGWSWVIFKEPSLTPGRNKQQTLELHFYVGEKFILLGTFIEGEWKTATVPAPRLPAKLPHIYGLPAGMDLLFEQFQTMYREILKIFKEVKAPPEIETMHTISGWDEGRDYDEDFPEGDMTMEEFNRLAPGDEFQYLVWDNKHIWIVDKVEQTERGLTVVHASRKSDGAETTFVWTEAENMRKVKAPEIETMHTISGWDEAREEEWKPLSLKAFDALKRGTNVVVRNGDDGTLNPALFLGRVRKKTNMGTALFAKVKYFTPIRRYDGEVAVDDVRAANVGASDVPEIETMHTISGWDEAIIRRMTERTGNYDSEYPLAGPEVDGRTVGEKIANTGSISSSLNEYEILKGIREVSFSSFDSMGKLSFYSVSEEKRTRDLAERIKASGEIDPLIVIIDKEGPYILEGGHRFDALRILGARSFPALVVIDTESTGPYEEAKGRVLRYLPVPEEGYPVDPETLKDVVAWAKTADGVTVSAFEGDLVEITRDTGEAKLQLIFYDNKFTTGYFFFHGFTMSLRLYGKTAKEPLNSLPTLIDQQALLNRNRARKFKFALPPLSAFYSEIVRRLFHSVPDVETMHTMSGWDESVNSRSTFTPADFEKLKKWAETKGDAVQMDYDEWPWGYKYSVWLNTGGEVGAKITVPGKGGRKYVFHLMLTVEVEIREGKFNANYIVGIKHGTFTIGMSFGSSKEKFFPTLDDIRKDLILYSPSGAARKSKLYFYSHVAYKAVKDTDNFHFQKLDALYREVIGFFTPTPDIETMHTISGWDESKTIIDADEKLLVRNN